jgi:hypothetical protein
MVWRRGCPAVCGVLWIVPGSRAVWTGDGAFVLEGPEPLDLNAAAARRLALNQRAIA